MKTIDKAFWIFMGLFLVLFFGAFIMNVFYMFLGSMFVLMILSGVSLKMPRENKKIVHYIIHITQNDMEHKIEQPELYQCPYEEAAMCDLKEGCLGCETFSEKINNANKHVL